MFRPLCMAIFRFSVQYSVRRFLFLVWSGGRDLTLQYMGGIGLMSGVLDALPGLGLLLLSVRGILHMGGARESVSTCKLSANRYDIYHCCVYSEKLLILDRGTV